MRVPGLTGSRPTPVQRRVRDMGLPALGPENMPGIDKRLLTEGGAMAKHHSRPSRQYRYEHYDPRM